MGKILDKFSNSFNNFNSSSILIILFWTVLFFILLKLAQRQHASFLNFVTLLFMLFSAIVVITCDINKNYYYFVPVVILLIYFMLFSTEVKRDIWLFAGNKLNEDKGTFGKSTKDNEDACVDNLIKAVQNMSKNRVGALIVLANSNFPQGILDTGTKINSDISQELIESIFFPNSPLHDGAMVISGTQIVSVGCFLPLSQENSLPKELGTRHRAGIGVTETVNVTSIIVSEETGVISSATGGKITRYLSVETLKQILTNYYWQVKED